MKIEQIVATHGLVLARAAQEETLHDWDNMPKRLVINDETFTLLANYSDHFKKHYAGSNGGTIDISWYKVERNNFTASVVTHLRSETTVNFVNKTFDIEFKRDGAKASDIAREIEESLRRYPGSRAIARVATELSIRSPEDLPKRIIVKQRAYDFVPINPEYATVIQRGLKARWICRATGGSIRWVYNQIELREFSYQKIPSVSLNIKRVAVPNVAVLIHELESKTWR